MMKLWERAKESQDKENCSKVVLDIELVIANLLKEVEIAQNAIRNIKQQFQT